MTPVTVTEVKNGTVVKALGTSIIVAVGGGGYKMFSQSDIDKRGIKIMRDGKVASISDLRENDRLTATIITSLPPTTMTEQQVTATLAKANPGAACGHWHCRCRYREARGARPPSRGIRAAGRCAAAGVDVWRRAEDAAQDRQPPSAAWDDGCRFALRGAGTHRQASSRDALAEW